MRTLPPFPHYILKMPRNARVVASGLPYHITQRGTNRERVFFTVGDRRLYLRLIQESLAEAGVRVLAYCLMTNHVECAANEPGGTGAAIRYGSQAIPTHNGARR
jgi:Transposase IS200 like